jgi:hypothetical protein
MKRKRDKSLSPAEHVAMTTHAKKRRWMTRYTSHVYALSQHGVVPKYNTDARFAYNKWIDGFKDWVMRDE